MCWGEIGVGHVWGEMEKCQMVCGAIVALAIVACDVDCPMVVWADRCVASQGEMEKCKVCPGDR